MHKCIGMHFGTMQVKAAMHQLLLNFRWSVPPDYELPIDWSSLPRPEGRPARPARQDLTGRFWQGASRRRVPGKHSTGLLTKRGRMVKLDLDMAWQQFRRLPTTAMEAAVLLRSGIAPVTKPQEIAYAMLTMRQWGMVAGAIKIAAHRDPDFPGLVDELGELTFRELDQRSNALANAWKEQGLTDRSVIAVLCRDHRGLVETMFAAGKLGAKLLLMNTGFAKPQFAEVIEREGADTLVYDIEFSEILGNVPDDVPRFLAWVRRRRRDDRAHHARGVSSRPRRPMTCPGRSPSAAWCCSPAARPAHPRARRVRSARRSPPRSSSTACRWA